MNFIIYRTLCEIENFRFLQELQQDVENHSDPHDGLDNTAQAVTRVCVEEVSAVEDDIQSVDKRWNDLNKNLQSKLTDIEALQGQLQEYKVAVDGVDEKISAVETDLNVERTPVSDVEEEKKHIEKLGALKEQLEELKPEFQSAVGTGNNIQEGNPSADTTAVESENKKLEDHYAEVQDKLADAIDKNKKVLADLEEYWEQEAKLEEQVKETEVKLEENKPTVMDAEKLKEQLEKAKVRSLVLLFKQLSINFNL